MMFVFGWLYKSQRDEERCGKRVYRNVSSEAEQAMRNKPKTKEQTSEQHVELGTYQCNHGKRL